VHLSNTTNIGDADTSHVVDFILHYNLTLLVLLMNELLRSGHKIQMIQLHVGNFIVPTEQKKKDDANTNNDKEGHHG
jgi:hypothetical protein